MPVWTISQALKLIYPGQFVPRTLTYHFANSIPQYAINAAPHLPYLTPVFPISTPPHMVPYHYDAGHFVDLQIGNNPLYTLQSGARMSASLNFL
jgi:hypothetical protein